MDQTNASRTGGISLKKKHAGGRVTSGISRGRTIVAMATALLVALAVLLSGAAMVTAATVTTVITGQDGPTAVAYNSTNNKIYVSNGNIPLASGSTRTAGNTVSVINSATDTVIGSPIVVGAEGIGPGGICYDPDNNSVYVANVYGGNASVINGATDAVTDTITGLHGLLALGSIGATYDGSNKRVYVSNIVYNKVYLIDATTNTVIAPTGGITVGHGPLGMCYSPTNNSVYVANSGNSPLAPDPNSNTVSVINAATKAVTATITVGYGPVGACYDSTHNKIYVANMGNETAFGTTVTVIDVPTGTTSTITVGSGPFGVCYNPNNDRIYVTNSQSNNVSVINGATRAVINTIALGATSMPLGADVNQNAYKIYAANFGSVDTSPGTSVSVITDPPPPPDPTTTSINPSSAIANSGAFTLTVNGTNFVDGVSVVRWDGVARTTHFTSSTVLTADILDGDITTAGTKPVTVFNDGATNPVSTPPLTFTINAEPPPDPHTTSISPTSKYAGEGAFSLTVNGSNFRAGSVVRWDGVARTTHYTSTTVLTADIPATDIAAVGSKPVTVYNDGAAFPESTPALPFTISTPPDPTTTTLVPDSKVAGQGTFTLTVNGGNFVDGVSQVRWNGNLKTTHYTSTTVLTADIPASDIATDGIANVTVRNPLAAVPDSTPALPFTINAPPVPTTTGLSPTSKTAGEAGFTLTVDGTNFVDGLSMVRWNGSARTTTCVSGTQLTAAIPASDIATAGTVPVTVLNGASESNAQTFTINAQTTPAITSVDPPSGPPGTQVTITGNNFGDSRGAGKGKSGKGASYVSFNGVNATLYESWSNTKIVCSVPEGATAGPVTVVTGAGTSNADKIFTVSYPTWYLAEGTCAWGFSTYITIENPNSTAVTAKITYMNPQASSGGKSGKGRVLPQKQITLPPQSQTTINPRDDLGYNTDFSTKVECVEGETIAVDRTMTWTGPGAPSPEAHSSIGTTSPSDTWYLPEGSTNWGFETWTLVQNPNATEASVKLTYMTEDAGPKVLDKKIPAFSRATYNMASDIGSHDSSIKVTSDVPVIAERSMYRNNRREGACSIGATAPAADYFLAEGTTDWGFTTYVLVQNPNDAAANVTVTYMTGAGPQPQAPFSMPANSRKTIRVNDVLPGKDLSTQVHADQPIIAERAMYWGADKPLGEASHDSVGMASPHTTFYLPDGQTSEGRETWTLVQNPNAEAVTVQISYLTPSGAGNVVFTDTVPANSRKTYNMADKGINGRAAIMVTSKTAGQKIMVERAMYWNSRGAGTDTIGGYSD